MYILLIGLLLIPLIIALVLLLAPFRHRVNWLCGWAFLIVGLAGIFAVFYTQKLAPDISFYYHWQLTTHLQLNASLVVDEFSAWMLSIIGIVGACVAFYSIRYMHKEPHQSRYFGYLSMFCFAMTGIVLTQDLLLIYVFWELVGLCSYLLIGFWHEKQAARRAAWQAFVVNRVGDAAFLVGIGACWWLLGSSDLSALSEPLPLWVALCLFAATIGKSAQLPLHFWLPDAMAGPTPASALIHAATMVAAGVYLFLRLMPFFPSEALSLIALLACLSLLWGAYAACLQTDMKRLLAYSTMSQLGYMIAGIALQAPENGFLHLLTHAFFKAGLFLSIGVVIDGLHRWQHEQQQAIDVQNMLLTGGWLRRAPIAGISYIVFAASLCGLPFTAGGLSKEALLADTWVHTQQPIERIMVFTMALGSLLTAFYTGKQLGLVWLRPTPTQQASLPKRYRIENAYQIPLLILATGSLWLLWSPSPFVLSEQGIWRLSSTPTSISYMAIYGLSGLVALVMTFSIWFHGFRPAKKQSKIFTWPNQAMHEQSNPQWQDRLLSLQFYLQWLVSETSKQEYKWYEVWIKRILRICNGIHSIDKNILDGLVFWVGRSVVILAHIIAWIDRVLIDGMVLFLAYISKSIGFLLSRLQNGVLQDYYWVAMLIAAFIVWWVL